MIRPPSNPDSTAVRVALWRAMHVLIDAPPHVLVDDIGIKLVNPPADWRERPDMHPQGTAPFRASIVARARFVEDKVKQALQDGVKQYVILGAGLDTFAQRCSKSTGPLQIFEIDKPDTQAWKQKRLGEIGFTKPDWLHFVGTNFESGLAWWEKLLASGLDHHKSAIFASMGVSMYLTKPTIIETLKQMSNLAPGSTFIMTFMHPLDLVAAEDRFGYERSIAGAARSGTPFLSFFTPEEMLKTAKPFFKNVEAISTADLSEHYFQGRSDGLRPSTGEGLLIATM